MEAKKKSKLYSQVFPNIEDWPIYKLSEDRERFIEEIDNETTKRLLLSHGDRIHEVISKTISGSWLTKYERIGLPFLVNFGS